MILVLLTSFGPLSLVSHAANSGLQIVLLSGESAPKIFEHCIIRVDIENLDDIGHHFMVLVYFSEQEVSEYGYISANEYARVSFSIVPHHHGQQSVVVDLYQDGLTLEAWVERKNATVDIMKTHSTYDETLSRFNAIEYDLDGIEGEIADNKNTLDVASAVIVIQFVAIFGIAWFFYRKFRAINEQISGLRSR